MRNISRIIILALLTLSVFAHAAEKKPLPKWVLTHTMGMMPATNWYGLNSLFPLTEYAKSRPDTYWTTTFGGQYRMLPLGAMYTFTGKDSKYNFNKPLIYPVRKPELSYSPEDIKDKYLWDLKWAERMGVDGYGILLSRNKVSKKHALGWFNAMEKILKQNPDTKLRLTIMFCGHELPNKKEPWRYEWLKEFCKEYKDSPAWLRHDGRIVFMGYRSMMTWSSKEGVKLEQAKKAVKAHKEFLKSLGMGDPIFLFDGTEYVPGDITHSNIKPNPELLAPIAEQVCKSFDGYMVWGGVIPDKIYQRNYPVIADAVNKSGKAWGMPIINIHSGIGQFYISNPGVSRLIDTWNYAYKTNAQFTQIVTWNDWNEATGYAPSISFNYAFTSLNQKFVHRFKNGKFPEDKEDKVYMFYRKYHPDADPYLYPRATVERDVNKWGETDDVLHVIVFANDAGTIKVSGTSKGTQTLKLKKGFNEFMLKTAINKEIAARIYRNGKLAHDLISPERVSDKPYREDLVPWGWSSDCRKYYDEEFGKGFRPISYYSQRYNDGIPDWFRLLYFGTTDMPAGGKADEDPDKDGITNLNEYLMGEDPTVPNTAYEAGYKWDELPAALALQKKGKFVARINQNPYPDKHGKLVHTFMYTLDEKLDGSYTHMNKWNNRGKVIGWSLRNWKPFYFYLTKDKGMGIKILPGYTAVYRFWSPVVGRIKYKCKLKGDAKTPVKFYIKKGAQELFVATCEPGNEITAEVEIDTALRDRIDFIVKPVGQDKANVVLYPEITLIEADKDFYKNLIKVKTKEKAKMKKLKSIMTGAALVMALSATAGEIAFDFKSGGSDRQQAFGTHFPKGRFDFNFAPNSFQVQGGRLRCNTKTQAWLILDDIDPEKANKSVSKDAEKLKATDFTARTMISDLSSGDGNIAGSAGFIIGITTPGKETTDGFLCLVDRVPGRNTGTLHVDKIAKSKRTDNLAKSAKFKYGKGSSKYFIQVKVNANKCQLSLFADSAITGKGTDVERLKSKDFDSAKPVATVSVDLTDYKGGFVGLFFEDLGGKKSGGASYQNFYLKK